MLVVHDPERLSSAKGEVSPVLGVQWAACSRCDLSADSVNSQRQGWCFAIFWEVLVAQELLLPRLCLPVEVLRCWSVLAKLSSG